MAIQIKSFLTDKADDPRLRAGSAGRPGPAFVPDAVIHDLTEVLELVGKA